ncbi:uncharacterized protein ASCRUDRAFT_83155 [Ascoidea rubescens DSM 1968]|uniref:Uncharacterized protein n=1 Tax=Ascoidea rubescens DSM 1968 TaxID=1344418 RepID=A0A1D2V8B4_9ASCO|nr:hypothetical protein ASCRUDRAFT_83155 [Ascoidea rubescens DSM 1968]ODV57882.1 hypothetical protein ASCRUDRAFT_83155 [Ascoidea rubescens DSM 1968]
MEADPRMWRQAVLVLSVFLLLGRENKIKIKGLIELNIFVRRELLIDDDFSQFGGPHMRLCRNVFV